MNLDALSFRRRRRIYFIVSSLSSLFVSYDSVEVIHLFYSWLSLYVGRSYFLFIYS